MNRILLIASLFLSTAATANYAASFDYSGTITDKETGSPISGAVISQINNSSVTTQTDTLGRYNLTNGLGTINPLTHFVQQYKISLRGNRVRFSLSNPAFVSMQLFNLSGKLLATPIHTRLAPGNFSFPLSSAKGMLSGYSLLQISVGARTFILPVINGASIASSRPGFNDGALSKSAAVMVDITAPETLIVTDPQYFSDTITATVDTESNLNGSLSHYGPQAVANYYRLTTPIANRFPIFFRLVDTIGPFAMPRNYPDTVELCTIEYDGFLNITEAALYQFKVISNGSAQTYINNVQVTADTLCSLPAGRAAFRIVVSSLGIDTATVKLKVPTASFQFAKNRATFITVPSSMLMHAIAGDFDINNRMARLYNPQGGDTIHVGDTVPITFAANPGTFNNAVYIDISNNAGKSWSKLFGGVPLAPTDSNWGMINWIVPDSIPIKTGATQTVNYWTVSNNCYMQMHPYSLTFTVANDQPFVVVPKM